MDGSADVIVGVDGSADAAAALRRAAAYGARHHLPVTAIASLSEPHDADPSDPRDTAFDLAASVTAALGANHEVRSTSTTARAADVLEQRSRTAELLVVGAGHLDRGGHHLLRPSVARDLAHRTACPVAIVRDYANRPDDPVVVGVDDSPASWRALQWSVDDCATTGRALVAVHAWHIDARTLGIVISDDEASRMERCASQVLDEVIAVFLASSADMVARHARTTVVIVPPPPPA